MQSAVLIFIIQRIDVISVPIVHMHSAKTLISKMQTNALNLNAFIFTTNYELRWFRLQPTETPKLLYKVTSVTDKAINRPWASWPLGLWNIHQTEAPFFSDTFNM